MAYTAEDRKKISRGAQTNALGKVIGVLQTFYLYIAHFMYGQESFGLFIIAHATMEMIARFLVGGFGDAATFFASGGGDSNQKTRNDNSKKYALINSSFLFPFGFSLIAALFMSLTANFWVELFWSQHGAHLTQILQIYPWFLPLHVLLKIPLHLVMAQIDMKWNMIVENMLMPMALLCFSVLFFFLGYNHMGLVASVLLSNLILIPISLYAYRQHYSLLENFKTLKFGLKPEILKFAIPQSINMVMHQMLAVTDTLMLSLWLPASHVSSYYLVANLFRSLRSIRITFAQVFSPLVARFKNENNHAGIQDALRSVTVWTVMLSIPLFLVQMFYFSDLICGIGVPWNHSLWIPLCLALGPMLSCFFGLTGNALLMTGHSLMLLTNSIILGLLNIVLNLWLIPLYGMTGAALATAISGATLTLYQMWQLQYYEKTGFDFVIHSQVMISAIIPILLAVAVHTTWVFSLFESTVHWMSFKITLSLFSLALYGFIFWKFFAEPTDKMKIKDYLRRKIQVPFSVS
jgi:O-antigen/teichoic acid export membrane protein